MSFQPGENRLGLTILPNEDLESILGIVLTHAKPKVPSLTSGRHAAPAAKTWILVLEYRDLSVTSRESPSQKVCVCLRNSLSCSL
jgi:hypothetical protein